MSSENNTPLSEAEGLPLTQSEAITALASATSDLARVVGELTYTPTVWVDNTEPDINAANLNKIEQGILQATNAINSAVDAISAINGNLSKLITGTINPDSPKDANLYTDTGAYTLGNQAQWTNLPSNTLSGIFLVRNCGVYISQVYVTVAGGADDLFFRTSFDSGQTWSSWIPVITNNDFGYIVGQAKTIINTPVFVENAPNSANYVPVITSHSETNSCLENVFWMGDKWYVYSTTEQIIKIRFYKYPV